MLFCAGFYLGAYVENSSVFSFLPDPVIAKPQQFYNVCGAVLIVFAVANGLGSRILRSFVCQWLGKLSFAVYLIHFIVLCSVISYLYTIVSEEPWALPLVFICFLGCSYLAAAVFMIVDSVAISVAAWIGKKLFPDSPVNTCVVPPI